MGAAFLTLTPGRPKGRPPLARLDGSDTIFLPLMLNSGETPILLYGLDFSPFMDGQSPDGGSLISEDQLRNRMQVISPFTRWIRTYGMDSGLELSGKVAHELSLKLPWAPG